MGLRVSERFEFISGCFYFSSFLVHYLLPLSQSLWEGRGEGKATDIGWVTVEFVKPLRTTKGQWMGFEFQVSLFSLVSTRHHSLLSYTAFHTSVTGLTFPLTFCVNLSLTHEMVGHISWRQKPCLVFWIVQHGHILGYILPKSMNKDFKRKEIFNIR